MKGKIVFVDDDPVILRSLHRLSRLEDDWLCDFFHSPLEALAYLEKNDCDIVVSDIMMEQVDGLELLHILKNRVLFQGIEVVMLTGLEDKTLKQRALSLGAVDLLTKPVTHEELTARINSVLQMISYRRQVEEKNRILEQQLASAQKMELVGALAAGTIHDLRSLLVVIGGLGNILQIGEEAPLEEMKHKFQKRKKMLLQSVAKAESLTGKILQLCRQEEFSCEVCELSALVQEHLSLFKSILPKTVTLKQHGTSGEHHANVCTSHFSQILLNILLNAAEAIEANGEIMVQVRRAETEEKEQLFREEYGDCAVVSVSDTGPGIPSKNLPHIFSPCFSTKKEIGGTGLGLFVTKWLVEQMHGKVLVESKPATGAVFKILLPTA